MPLTVQEKARLDAHYVKQDALAKRLPDINAAIEKTYHQAHFVTLKDELKAQLCLALGKKNDAKPLIIDLVDIQNDFVLEGFGLYANGGENTVTSNMALLDAIAELNADKENYPTLANDLLIVTSQDAHKLGRDELDNEYKVIKRKYPDTADQILAGEKSELEAFDPVNSHFDLHCMVGTIGAAIATPIEARLCNLILDGLTVKRFLKTNFSGPDAGLAHPDQIKVSSKLYRDNANPIYSDKEEDDPETYLEYFKRMNPYQVWVTGICGNVCVQQAAEGLKKDDQLKACSIQVVDACQHHLVIHGVTIYDDVREEVEKSYADCGVDVLTQDCARSNPDCNSEVYALFQIHNLHPEYLKPQQNNPLLAFYLAHSAACDAILATIAIAAVVTITVHTFGLAPLAFMALYTLAAAAGIGTFFHQKNQLAKAEEQFDNGYEAEKNFTIS